MIGTVVMLVGLPMSGKSTFLKNKNVVRDAILKMNISYKKDDLILSSDDIVSHIADVLRLTYNETWDIIHPHLSNAFEYHVKDFFEMSNRSLNESGSVIFDLLFWDQTNLSKKSRMKKLSMIPEGWKKVALYFPEPSSEELKKRKQKRKEEGKEISNKVYKSMKQSFDFPDVEEGFDEVFRITDVLPENFKLGERNE